ncbi:MAG: hypothetical protein PVF13_07835, partial [Chromatiales bacterium]
MLSDILLMCTSYKKTDHYRDWCIGIFLCLSLVSVSAASAAPHLTLTVKPNQISLCRIDQPIHALLILENKNSETLLNVCIKSLTNGPVNVSFESPAKTDTKDSKCPGGMYLAEIKSNA